mgnify:CR=1 FL=1
MRLIFVSLVLWAAAGVAFASQCVQLAGGPDARVWQANLSPGEVRILFIGHSAFRIETDQGATVVTDFYGDPGPGDVPDAVTMNHAHSSHWTPFPDPAIAHPLKGWAEGGQAADHWLELGNMLVRNVPTDIRRWDGGAESDGNSIFIFEYEDLCIGHLGHLHHEPSEADYGMIGRLDVVMAPVDGGQTLETPVMLRVLKRLRARLVLPMHHLSNLSLQEFLAGMADDYTIVGSDDSELTISARTLPSRPTVRLLAPLREPYSEFD